MKVKSIVVALTVIAAFVVGAIVVIAIVARASGVPARNAGVGIILAIVLLLDLVVFAAGGRVGYRMARQAAERRRSYEGTSSRATSVTGSYVALAVGPSSSVNRAVTAIGFGFVGLSTVAVWLLPIALYFIIFGRIGGFTFTGCYTTIWLAIVVWVVRARRRRFGRFWPTKWA